MYLGSSRDKQQILTVSDDMVSIIVPVFNLSDQVIENLKLLDYEIRDYFRKYEIIVISDGSTDGTNEALDNINLPQVIKVVLPENMGKGAAIREGFKTAKGDYIFFIDGGMELHPRDLRIFVGLMRIYDADIVLGSKRHPQSQVHYPASRKLLSWIFQVFVRLLFEIDVTDTQVGLKLLKKDVVNALLPYLRTDRYGFDLEILTFAQMQGFTRFLEAPIQLDYFLKNRKPFLFEIIHIVKVGISLLKDTILLYMRIRQIKLEIRR